MVKAATTRWFLSQLALFLLLSLVVKPLHAVRECLQPIRKRVWDPPCYKAEVPKTISSQQSSSTSKKISDDSSASCPNKILKDVPELEDNEEDDVCSFVAQAIFADMPVFDIVFLNQGTCANNVDISQGIFTPREAGELLPYRNELVALRLLGKHIVIALEHGETMQLVADTKDNILPGAKPKTAGLRYQFDPSENKGHRVSNVHVMGYTCGLERLEPETYYTVLTNQFLARGGDGYGVFTLMAKAVIPTGVSETDSFWFHAQSTCKLDFPWKTKWQHENEVARKNMGSEKTTVVYKVGRLSPRNHTASVLM